MSVSKRQVAEPVDIPEPLGLRVSRSVQGLPAPNYVVAATQMLDQFDEHGRPLATVHDESDPDFVTFRFQMSRRLLQEGDLHYRKVDGRLVTAIQEVIARKVNDALKDPQHLAECEYQNALAKADVKSQRYNGRRGNLPSEWGEWSSSGDGTAIIHAVRKPELQYIYGNTDSSDVRDWALIADEECAYANGHWYADTLARYCYEDAPLSDHFQASDLTDADILQADIEHGNRALKTVLNYGLVDNITLPRNFQGTVRIDNPATRMDNAEWLALSVKPLDVDLENGEDIYTLQMHDGCAIRISSNGNWWVDDTNGKRIYDRQPQRGFNPYMNTSDLMEQFMGDMAGVGFTQDQFLKLPVEVFINWLILRAAEHDGDDVPEDITRPQDHPATQRITEQPRCLYCGADVPQSRADAGIQFCGQAHAVEYMNQQGVS